MTPADGGATIAGTRVQPDVDWVASIETFTLSQPANFRFQVHTYDPLNGCVLVDDVALYAR